ncbi:MAG: type II secretion system F family protein [Candidatus Aminicenantes bacterium]|nr:type II secretion system F family protein [Candidatus Aminicenantes bacterium]
MALYVWTGKNKFGDVVHGERVARSVEELNRILQREQIQVQKIQPMRVGLNIPFLKMERVRLKELAVYSRQLSVLIDAELPLIQSLNILIEQTKNRYFKKVITSIREDVEAGASLNQAKRKFPRVFDDLYCNLIASGEQSGSLDIMLRRISEYIEKILKIRGQVRQAMIYPSAIISFAVLVTIFMMWKVIPVFGSIFTELGAELPFLTQLTLGSSQFVADNILFIFLGLIALVFAFRFARRTGPGRKIIDRFLLRIPLFGGLLVKVAISRMTRTLSTLLAGGVAMLESLKITSTTTNNVIIEESVLDARRQVSEGRTLSDSFRETGRFPFLLTQMVSVGEATGTLDAMLSKLADFYDEEVSATVGALLSVLEPILLIGVGGMVGMLIVSMYLPIFDLMGKF